MDQPDQQNEPVDPFDPVDEPLADIAHTRLELIWSIFVFQLKLIADGLRDLILSPLSLIAGVMGLLAGGEQPDHYFKQVIRFGRRSEHWINLFGHSRRKGTADDLIAPIQKRVFSEAEKNPWISKAGTQLNRKLDEVNSTTTQGKPGAHPRDKN